MRGSPGLIIFDQLKTMGAEIDYSDPHVAKIPLHRGHLVESESFIKSVELKEKSIKDYDCVVLATDHDAFDYGLISKFSKVLVDTRGVYNSLIDTKIVRS